MKDVYYCITVHDELTEFKRLIHHLLDSGCSKDKILVLHDANMDVTNKTLHEIELEANIISKISSYCTSMKISYHATSLNGDFSKFKNQFSNFVPENDYIFQIDADELPSKEFIHDLNSILELNSSELFWIPRINTVKGITEDHIQKWKWNLDPSGRINYPDYQSRLYKNVPSIRWKNKVHERIHGHTSETYIPQELDKYAILHDKDIVKQERQNQMYENM